MSKLHRAPEGFVAYTKGAPEAMIPLCIRSWPISEHVQLPHFDPTAWLARADTLASQGLRVLAIARRTHCTLHENTSDTAAIECNLCLIGLIGLMDPPRAEAAAAVRKCKTARFAYNWALAEWGKQYDAWKLDDTQPKPTQMSLRRGLNAIKKEAFPWMLEVTKNAPQMAIIQLGAAFQNFFAGRAKYPTFKKKGKVGIVFLSATTNSAWTLHAFASPI